MTMIVDDCGVLDEEPVAPLPSMPRTFSEPDVILLTKGSSGLSLTHCNCLFHVCLLDLHEGSAAWKGKIGPSLRESLASLAWHITLCQLILSKLCGRSGYCWSNWWRNQSLGTERIRKRTVENAIGGRVWLNQLMEKSVSWDWKEKGKNCWRGNEDRC